MVVLFCIIGIVTLFSMYEFFSSRNWQQVTSSTRNDVVFEKRNKEYGAYAMRRDYNKHLVAILFFLTAGLGMSYGAFRLTRIKASEIKKEYMNDWRLITVDIPINEKIEIPVDKIEMQKASQATFEFVEPEVTDNPEQNSDPVIIPDGNTTASSETNLGEEGFPTDPNIGTETVIIDTKPDVNEIVEGFKLDEQAEFPGGVTERMKFLGGNIKYPEIAVSNELEGPCYLQFVVSNTGDISSVKVIRGVKECPECDKEAMRVVKSMPRWKPGKINGKAVNSIFNLKVNFELNH
jgi:protein TonB